MVKNAADEAQVKEAGTKEKRAMERDRADLKAVLSTPEGRRFIARLLAKFKIAGRVWTPSAEIHRNVGIMEAGQFILGEVITVDKVLGAQMLADAYEKEIGDSDV